MTVVTTAAHHGRSGKSVGLGASPGPRWHGLADLAVRARDRLSPEGYKKRQGVDPAWPPVQAATRQMRTFPRNATDVTAETSDL
jgi:hypothetical protein